VLTVAGDPLKELAVGVITDTGKGGSTVSTITQSCRSAQKRFQAVTVIHRGESPPGWRCMAQSVDDYRLEDCV